MSAETDDSGVLRSILPPEQVDRAFETCDNHGWKLLVAGAVVGVLPPLLGLEAGYFMTVLTEMYLFGVLALSWDIVGGQTGYPSFGNMAFFGIGAYTTAILTKDFAVAFPLAFLSAGVVATAFALIIGLIVLRLRGHYFAIATLGVLLAAQQVSRNLSITGGASGKILLQTPPGEVFYYVFLGILVLEAAVIYYLSSTRFGFVLNAIRDDEAKATAMGFNTTYYKTAAWGLAALFTGAAGGAYGLFNTFINPQTAYNAAWNVELIAMALLGGSGTVVGPIIGAFGLHTVIEIVESYAVGWQLVLLGLAIIGTVIAIPEGIVGALREYASEMDYYERGGMAATDETDAEPSDDGAPTGGDPQ
ncbi:branched-chain amino acid ABC transporter permease [Halomicroarcula limicola]|uniref:Branched-chain amino acid ABC transporter permease n=1 Tax=Haloarcula limicola TaxID=1429915 RepID=A0A8J8C3P4_9EURY|nr:branched-chain amino acid ABC transporter permease [Halomicroarcula limicola]MBV0924537.1 branched-chain amino acid ABC transporter permease [Halomicroarcula limicola]